MFQTGLNKDFAKPALKHKHYDNKKKKKLCQGKITKNLKFFSYMFQIVTNLLSFALKT